MKGGITMTIKDKFKELDKFEFDGDWKFNVYLKKSRQEAGLTQATMSKELQIPKRTIEDWEGEKSKPPIYLQKLILKEVGKLKKRDEVVKFTVEELQLISKALRRAEIDYQNEISLTRRFNDLSGENMIRKELQEIKKIRERINEYTY